MFYSRFSIVGLVLALLIPLGLYLFQDQIFSKVVHDATAGQVQVDRHGNKTKVEVGGTTLENQQGKLVDGFPTDVPFPKGFEVQSSTKIGPDIQATGSVPNAPIALADVTRQLATKEWKVSTTTSAVLIAKRGARQVVYSTSPQNIGASFTVVVSQAR
ncbi:MAG: hypothetical protein JWM05_1662 [Acidimicrobiales bacterium]|nr:hypothetical protein [Acidimicrobiales bacterium]